MKKKAKKSSAAMHKPKAKSKLKKLSKRKIKHVTNKISNSGSKRNINHKAHKNLKSKVNHNKSRSKHKVKHKLKSKAAKKNKSSKHRPKKIFVKKRKVIPSIISRVPTNIPKFDKLIEGGFEKNSTNLLVGDSGAGKSIFATAFLIGGMINGEKALYVTFEEKKDQFYQNMKRFGWDLADFERRGLFTFLEYTPIKVQTMLEEGGGAIETLIVTKKIKRMVIDSITSFALLFDDELQKREAALSLFNMISRWNCTSLLTLEGQPLTDEKMASRTLEFESDSIILLYLLREGNERHRYLEIIKMRGTKHSKKIFRFHIANNGINLYSKPANHLPI